MATTKDFLLPDLGEGLTEGEVVSWLVAVGDAVEVDQPVAEVETAKAVVEVPSPFAGTVLTLHAQPGEEVQVGTPLITIDVGGADAAAPVPAEGAQAQPASAPASAGEEQAAQEEGSGSVLVGYGTTGGRGSRRRRTGGAPGSAGQGAAGQGAAGNGAADGRGAGGQGTPQPAPQPQPEPEPQPVAREGKPMAKPPVRKMAKDLGVDLALVPGTGPDGIITRADVQAFADGRGGGAAAVPETEDYAKRLAPAGEEPLVSSGGPRPAAAGGQPAAPDAGGERVRLSQMRKAISAQMTRSRREIPEAVTWVEADATPLADLRRRLNEQQAGRPDAVKVSALAIQLRIVVAGLRRFPTLNAQLDVERDELVLHRGVHLGVAAQTDRGLVVPVIRDADRMGILELAAALSDLAATARAGKLTPEQMTGGTFTVSNYGAFGVDGGDMVINHPEAAILGTGRIVDKPWVVDGEVAVRKVTTYSIAFDHRIIDGGEAAGFLRFVADCTEDPTTLLSAL